MNWLKRKWYWLLLGAAALATVCMDVYAALRLLDGDTSDYVYRGWLMARNHDFFLLDYWRTTELRLFDLPMVYALFFLFVEDWSLVRILGSVLMQGLYVLSFLYMGRQAGIRKPVRVACAALLLAPFSTAYARLMLYHCYYILYMTEAFLLAGLTLHTLRLWQQGRRRALIPGILLGVLWVLAGLNGVRHMMIVGVPLLLFAFIRLIRALNECGWKKALLRTEAFRLWVILLGACLCFLTGYGINTVLLPILQVAPSTLSPFKPEIRPEELTNLLNMWLMAIGVRVSPKSLLSLRGAALAAALFSAVYGLIRSLRCREQDTGRAMLGSLLGLSTLVNTVIFLLDRGSRYYELYYVPVIAMIFPLLAVELDGQRKAGQRAMCLLCCLCLVFSSAYTALFMLTKDKRMDQWTGLVWREMYTTYQAQECADFMQQQGYTHALCYYWYATPMMELTDGQLTVAPREFNYAQNEGEESTIFLEPWGTSKTAFKAENLPDTLLVFVRWSEMENFTKHFPQLVQVWESQTFSAYEMPKEMLILP